MKVLGLISSLTDPASRIRIMQYRSHFQKNGHFLQPKFYNPLKEKAPPKWAKIVKQISGINEWRTYDLIKTIGRSPLIWQQGNFNIIWQNRLLQIKHLYTEKWLKKPVAFDFDDAIWINEGEKQVRAKIRMSNLIMAGNEYLANYAKKINKETYWIPSTIDTDYLIPLQSQKEKFTIGWIGTEFNQNYLIDILPAILMFLQKYPESCLKIVSNIPSPKIPFDGKRIVFQTWSPNEENKIINSFSVGLMPLPDSEWSLGKCSYKMLQYMACGIPYIVSPIGQNEIILKQSVAGLSAKDNISWLNSLITIFEDKELRTEMGTNGRTLVENNFSAEKWAPKIIHCFNKIV